MYAIHKLTPQHKEILANIGFTFIPDHIATVSITHKGVYYDGSVIDSIKFLLNQSTYWGFYFPAQRISYTFQPSLNLLHSGFRNIQIMDVNEIKWFSVGMSYNKNGFCASEISNLHDVYEQNTILKKYYYSQYFYIKELCNEYLILDIFKIITNFI